MNVLYHRRSFIDVQRSRRGHLVFVAGRGEDRLAAVLDRWVGSESSAS